jgi:hypothetical protein
VRRHPLTMFTDARSHRGRSRFHAFRMATRPALRHRVFAAGERPQSAPLTSPTQRSHHPHALIHSASSSSGARPKRVARAGWPRRSFNAHRRDRLWSGSAQTDF